MSDPDDGEILDRGDELEEEGLEVEAPEGDEELPDPRFEEDEDEEEKDGKITVPKSRLDKATKKFREREQELLEQIEAARKQPQSQQAEQKSDSKSLEKLQETYDGLQDRYEELLIDGEKDKAREIRRQMTTLNRQIQQAEITRLAAQSRFAAVEDIKYDQALTTYEETYPEINPASETYDKTLVAEVAELKDAYQKSGYAPTAALKKAVGLLLKSRAPATQPESGLRQQRAQQAREKVTRAVKGQPPAASKAGRDNTPGLNSSSVLHMSQAEFAKLSEEQLSSLRGDMVE